VSGPSTIGFRLSPEYLERLDENRAKESRGGYARAVLMSHLDAKDNETSIEALRMLHDEVQKVAKRLDTIGAELVTKMLTTQQLMPPVGKPAPAGDSARLANIEKELLKVRRDVANGILQLLVQTQPLTAAQANTWARTHMPD